MYLLKLALRPWKVAPISQVFSGLAVGVLLLLAGLLAWMEVGMRPVLARLKNEQVVTAYLKTDFVAKNRDQFVDSIRLAAGARPEDVRFVEAKDFLAELGVQYPELAKELDDLGGDMDAIIPRYVSVSGALAASAAELVRSVPGVESVDTSKDRNGHVLGAFLTLRWLARLLAGGLCLALLTGLIHLARMNAHLHRDVLGLLRLWGAGDAYLRVPGMLSCFWVGAFGGAVAAGGWLLGGVRLIREVKALSPMLHEMALPAPGVPLVFLAAGAAAGILAGMLGGSPYAGEKG